MYWLYWQPYLKYKVFRTEICDLEHTLLLECGESLPDHQAPLLSHSSTMKPEAWGLRTQCMLSSGSTGVREKKYFHWHQFICTWRQKKIRVTSSDAHLLFHDGDHIGQSSYHLTTVWNKTRYRSDSNND